MSTQGTTTVNFGSFPGASDASVAVTGQASITTSNLVEAWIYPVATADHSADEHWVETIKCSAGNIVNATGFTIYALNTNQINEPVVATRSTNQGTATSASSVSAGSRGGAGTRLYGQWTVAWVWN